MRYTFFCWWISSKQDLYLVFLLNNSLSKNRNLFVSSTLLTNFKESLKIEPIPKVIVISKLDDDILVSGHTQKY